MSAPERPAPDLQPCPAWCQGEPDHPQDEVDSSIDAIVHHFERVAVVPYLSSRISNACIDVQVLREDHVHDATGRVEVLPLGVRLFEINDLKESITSSEARALAAALVAAADRLAVLNAEAGR